MKIVVTHRSPDLDAISSVWLLKRFLPGWEDAKVEFVPAGNKLPGEYENLGDAIEKLNGEEIIHVDTGLGALDHHQTQDNNVCAASLTYEFVLNHNPNALSSHEIKTEAVGKMVQLVVDEDHFQEIYYTDSLSYLYDFSINRMIDGFKILHPGQDDQTLSFGIELLDCVLHVMEARIWAEHEVSEKGMEFKTRWGLAMAVESVNDAVLEIVQKKGYVLAVRRDPNHGFIRIKARPLKRAASSGTYGTADVDVEDIDLTPVYEKIKEVDPDSNWFLHVSKKMLLNGSTKNPTMSASKLSLSEVMEILKKI